MPWSGTGRIRTSVRSSSSALGDTESGIGRRETSRSSYVGQHFPARAAAWAAAQRQPAAATLVRTVPPALFRVPFCIDPPALLARTLKRFLNVYRLIRTKCYYDSFANERGHASDFCGPAVYVVMFLLAIVTSQPDSGNAFLSRLIKPPDPPALSPRSPAWSAPW